MNIRGYKRLIWAADQIETRCYSRTVSWLCLAGAVNSPHDPSTPTIDSKLIILPVNRHVSVNDAIQGIPDLLSRIRHCFWWVPSVGGGIYVFCSSVVRSSADSETILISALLIPIPHPTSQVLANSRHPLRHPQLLVLSPLEVVPPRPRLPPSPRPRAIHLLLLKPLPKPWPPDLDLQRLP